MANATGSVVYGTHSATDIDIRGWTAEMPSIYNINIERGRAFTPGEESRRMHIALIGPDIVDNQMGGGPARQGNSRRRRALHRHRRGRAQGQDPRPEPGQLGRRPAHHLP